jgi:hypothetical protein
VDKQFQNTDVQNGASGICVQKEEKKKLVIVEADSVIDPRTMVIHSKYYTL